MDETRVNWWMDDTSHWHRGYPPTGWRQAPDGRWHPPGDDDEPTDDFEHDLPAGAPRHARGTGSHVAEGWGWPRWARIAVLASVASLAVVVVAVAVITDDSDRDDQLTATANIPTTAPSTSAAPSTPTTPPGSSSVADESATDGTDTSAPPTTARATTSTTSRPATTTTSPPPTDPGVQLSAPCSPEGATAVSVDGVPVTCTTQKCHGAPFASPRWRRTAC